MRHRHLVDGFVKVRFDFSLGTSHSLRFGHALGSAPCSAEPRGAPALDASRLLVTLDGVRLWVRHTLSTLDDAPAYLEACASLLATVRDAGFKGRIPVTGEPSPSSVLLRHCIYCAYCASEYFFSPSQSRCPNCGAAPSAS